MLVAVTKPIVMKHLVFFIGFIGMISYTHPHSFAHISHTADITWDSTKNWKIYKLQNFRRVFGIPADSLQYLDKRSLNDDSMHLYLLNATKLPPTNPAWMGCYLTSYETSDGEIRKAIISYYGGFFYCQLDNAFFQINSNDQHGWMDYLANCYMNIPKTKSNKDSHR
jgi:hypothetical protein